MSSTSALPPVWSTSSGASHAEVPSAHSGTSVGQFHRMHYAAALFPLTGGALLFGWRAVAVVAVVVGSAALALLAWRRGGAGGGAAPVVHGGWDGAVLGVLLAPAPAPP